MTAAAAESDWQPIETAPHDGSDIILLVSWGDTLASRTGRWHTRRLMWSIDYGVTRYLARDRMVPIRWMPLPPPPEDGT